MLRQLNYIGYRYSIDNLIDAISYKTVLTNKQLLLIKLHYSTLRLAQFAAFVQFFVSRCSASATEVASLSLLSPLAERIGDD
jgi:hypothetical protein